ncbi:MAG: uncharacterized protein PWQ37_3036 [Candidatus Petromonas sp.]|jgi:putative phosphoesterase|nr:uncharacterized protein [Candidatus Petromonas sp.]
MKLGIISDSHGDTINLEKAVKAMGHIDILIHAGDTYNDAMYLKEKFDLEVVGVKGNTDLFSNGVSETTFKLRGKKILLTHGHKYGIKYSLDKLYYKSLELNADIVIFGHSHIPCYLEENGVIFINPGSVSRPRGGSGPSYAIMEIKADGVEVKIQELV